MKTIDAPERTPTVRAVRTVTYRRERRRFSQWHQAYLPRRWPSLLIVPPALLTGRPVMAAVLSVLAVDFVRMLRWERRHPRLTPLELLEVKCAWAPYN